MLCRRIGGVPAVVAFHVGEPEERLRPDVFEAWHTYKACFERHGYVALDLLGAPALWLRDDFDHGRHRVGIGLNVELEVRTQADSDEGQGQHSHDEWRADSGGDEFRDHGLEHSGKQNGARGDHPLTCGNAANNRQILATQLFVD